MLTHRSPLSLSWPVYQDVSTALAISSNLAESESKVRSKSARTVLTVCVYQDIDLKLRLDLEYLATFLARLPRLQLHHTSLGQAALTEFYGLIHLTGLSQLRELSLSKIPVHLIQDLVHLREELESLSLQRCCFTVDSLVSGN